MRKRSEVSCFSTDTVWWYNVVEKHSAESMAELVENWLDNPVSRSVLKFCTAQTRVDGE